MGALAVDRLFVLRYQVAVAHEPLQFGLRQHAHPRGWRAQERVHELRRAPLPVQHADEGFPDAHLREQFVDLVEVADREILRRELDGFAVLSREGPERVLDLHAELPENRVGQVSWVLGDKDDADALRADQLDDRLELVEQRVAGLVEHEVGLVDEDYELRLVGVAALRHRRVDLGHHLQHERAEQLRAILHVRQADHAAHAMTVLIAPQQILHLEARLAEEAVAALLLQLEQTPHDCARR